MRKYETVYSFNVLDEVANGERILLIDRATESINSLDEISTRDLAIAIKAENKDNRYEFYKEVEINENLFKNIGGKLNED
jgi:hypothetical protein